LQGSERRGQERHTVSELRRLEELERQRTRLCRLTPDRALTSLNDARAFLAERGMLTRMPDSSLPSLFGACHEEPGKPGGKGFDLWPKTKWIWSFQLTLRPGNVLTKLHRGKSLYLSAAVARVFDPLIRDAMSTATGDDAELLGHLSTHGDSMSEDIGLELGWERNRLKKARDRLERVGALVSDGLVFVNQATWHFAPLRRWDQVVKAVKAPVDPYAEVLLAGVRAAVIVPQNEVDRWFSWPFPEETLNQLVKSGRVARPAPGWIALRDKG